MTHPARKCSADAATDRASQKVLFNEIRWRFAMQNDEAIFIRRRTPQQLWWSRNSRCLSFGPNDEVGNGSKAPFAIVTSISALPNERRKSGASRTDAQRRSQTIRPGGGCHRRRSSRLNRWGVDAAHMPELQDHAATGDAHGFGYDSPAVNLLLGMDTWC